MITRHGGSLVTTQYRQKTRIKRILILTSNRNSIMEASFERLIIELDGDR